MFPIDGLPYTFVTGFDASGNIVGVCGYGGYYNVHAWYNCTWDLTGTQRVTVTVSNSLGSPLSQTLAVDVHALNSRVYLPILTK